MCSLILIALNTFLATPGCVTPDGPATVAAQQWGAYSLAADGYTAIVPIYQQFPGSVTVGVVAHGPEAYVGFTWFSDSSTLVVEDARYQWTTSY